MKIPGIKQVEMKGNLLVDVISLEWALGTAEFRGSNRDIRAVLYL